MKHDRKLHLHDLKERIAKACEGLVYISETDAAIELFVGEKMKEPSADALFEQAGMRPTRVSESTETGDLFGRLTKMEEWHTQEHRKSVERFRKLERLLEKELTEIVVIRAGKIRIDIYVIGRDREGNVLGIKTQAVET